MWLNMHSMAEEIHVHHQSLKTCMEEIMLSFFHHSEAGVNERHKYRKIHGDPARNPMSS